MPLPPNTETLLPQLLANYATTRREDFELPDSTALPFLVAPLTEEQTFPRVVFVTSGAASPHPKRLNLTISVELQSDAKTQDTTAENAYAAALRYILADIDAFQTWLQGQSEAIRTGYRITKYRIAEEASSMGIDEKGQTRGRKTDVVIHVRTDELAPAA